MSVDSYRPVTSVGRDAFPRPIGVLLSVVAIILMAATLLLHSGRLDDVIMWDEADYALAAQRGIVANALDLDGLNRDQRHYHAPLSFYGIRLSTWLLGLNNLAVRLPGIIVSALTSGLVVLVGYDLARGSRLTRMGVGTIAGALFATAPASILMTTTARPHPFVAFFLVLNIWTLCRYLRRPSRFGAVAFGLCLAGQFVSMEYGPIVVVFSLLAIGLVRPQRLGLPRRRRRTMNRAWGRPHRDVWVALGSCVAAIVVVWPAGLFKLGVLLNFAYYVRYAKLGHRALFRGQIYDNVPKYAYAWWYVTEYPLLWVGMVVAAVVIPVWAWRRRGAVAVTLAVFALGLIACVHGSHIMELCYSLYMIPPLVLGGPLACAWFLGASRTGTSFGCEHTVSQKGGWRPSRLLGAGLCVLALMTVVGGRMTPAPPNDQDNTKLVAVSRRLAGVAGRGDRVLAQAWPVVRFVLLQEGRHDLTVVPYNPANYVSDDLQGRFDAGSFDWIITAGSTASAASACPLLSQIQDRWTVVVERGSPPREYRLYSPPAAIQAVSLINDPGGAAASKSHTGSNR